MTLQEFRLPDIGEGIAEGEIVSWKVEVGQQVAEEDEFVEVMTDKATVTITVPYDGVIKELRCQAGDVVPVETVIAVIDTAGGAAAAPAAEPEANVEPEAAAEPEANAEPAAAPRQVAVATAPDADSEPAAPGKVLAAPATRLRAREMGVDLREVRGTGPRGRVTNADLQTHLRSGEATSEAAPAAPGPKVTAPAAGAEERVPFRGLRRRIAEAMSRSKRTAAHFTYVDDVDVTELVKLRAEAKAEFAGKGVNVTYLPFVMKAVVEAHKQFPTMNSSLDETSDELVVKHYYNFGIATDTDKGLIVPVVKDVGRKSIVELARDIQELARATREGSIAVDDLQGGTFTLTNAGNIGGLLATPVINFPEVAILGVHAIKKTPIVTADGRIAVGDVMYLSISIDHRIVDGATGARWMNVVKECLERPRRLLLGRL